MTIARRDAAKLIGLSALFGLGGARRALAAPAGPVFTPIKPGFAPLSLRQVEVLYFFSYAAPHCFALEQALGAWVTKNASSVAFRRVPVVFGHTQWSVLAKHHTALAQMGLADSIGLHLFSAIHVQRLSLSTDADIVAFVVSQGVDRAKYMAELQSFGLQSAISRDAQITDAANVGDVPSMAVDGKYLATLASTTASATTSASAVNAAFLANLDLLVAKAARERAPAKKP